MNLTWHSLLLRAVNCTSDDEAETIFKQIEELIAADRKRLDYLQANKTASSSAE